MSVKNHARESRVRYQPDETPPPALALGIGLQLAVLNIAAVMLIPTVVMRAAGASEAYVLWAVLASVAICGLTTMLQAARAGRIGAGHVMVMGTSGAFIPACISALTQSGPATLATLVAVSALVPVALSWRLSLFQRILTPTVSGTVLMLIPITVMPAVSGMLAGPPGGTSPAGVLPGFFITVVVIGGIALRATGALRLWAPIIGVVIGSAIAGFFGLYDLERVAEASWVSLPRPRPPGLALDVGPAFWTLLPSFLLVAVIAAIRTMSSAVAIQRASWRRERAVDFRAVQGAVAVDGVGNLLAGLAGTVPGSATTLSVSLTELTGVAARAVGVVAGGAFIAFVFLPKLLAVILAIPDPVFAGYLVVLLAMLFAIGLKIVLQGGLDFREGMVVGIAVLTGIGFQYGLIFPEQVSAFAGGLLANGMNAGGFAAILMTLFLRLTEARPSRFETNFDLSELPRIRDFLGDFVSRGGWDSAMAERLGAAAEEALLTLARQDQGGEEAPGQTERGRHLPLATQKEKGRRLLLVAKKEKDSAVLEFIVAPRDENLQDRIALAGEDTDESAIEREVSLRLLRHLASSVRHQQYHDTDIVTVRVQAPG